MINKTGKTFCPCIINRIKNKQEAILRWLDSYEGANELPIYSSVDIRDAGYKMAVVDTNIFPAGFNNLCEHGLEDAINHIKEAILKRVPEGKNILIIAEEHTRNTWYLENVRVLEGIIQKAGFTAKIASFLHTKPNHCDKIGYVELTTATNKKVKIHCFQSILKKIEDNTLKLDLIILNNDLTTGIPEVLQNTKIPIYPSIQAGWHSRLKSHHFKHTNELIKEFAKLIDIDPWLFSTLFDKAENIDINLEVDRKTLTSKAENLFKQIAQKYQEHNINEKPYIVLKADSGTYGMGVMTIETPEEIMNLNRKKKNKLIKGKSSKIIENFLLQEGVPTVHCIENEVSEVTLYQVENKVIGGFYRSHAEKNERENLNSKGMNFKKMCPHLKKYGDCGIHHDINIFDIYRILARIAGIAAHREIMHLEKIAPHRENIWLS